MSLRSSLPVRPAVVLALLCAFVWSPSALLGEEFVVQNDSIVDFGTAVIVGDFVEGEMAGARLASPCNGTLVAVQILWLEGSPGHGESLENAIHIYDGTSFPTPGTELETLVGPVMTPGYWNEFRYLDEAQVFPLEVPVTEGQEITIALEFFNPTSVGTGGPSIVRDVDGCQDGRNVLGGNLGMGWDWYNFCMLLAGDVAIRMVIDCDGVTGACCRAIGSCVEEQEEEDCQEFGDEWHEGLTCGEITCIPSGACCRMGGCLQLIEQSTCEGPLEGVYAGNGTNCVDSVCVEGACCDIYGDCTEVFEVECGDDFQGPGTTCEPNLCEQPQGACCFGTFCQSGQTEDDCVGAAGEWVGPFTDCGPPNPCEETPDCPWDLSGNGIVDPVDVGIVKQYYGCAVGTGDPVCDQSDLSGNGDVDPVDVGVVKQHYGPCP